MTNAEYAKDKAFVELCMLANVNPTARQASKFRRKVGAVYKINMGDKSIHVPSFARIYQ